MLLFLIVLGLVAIVVLVVTLLRLGARKRTFEHAEETKKKLNELLRAVMQWQGSEYDFVPYDSDRKFDDRNRGYRSLTLRPDDKVAWDITTDPQMKCRVKLRWKDAQGEDREFCYPSAMGFSEEQWLKTMVDIVLWYVHEMPPPRTHEEWMAKRRQETAATIARAEARSVAEGDSFSSLEDPLDDMD
ncbi:MAG: hypothetical protein WC866_06110 [Patescibacteria group bacterium]|jgi:hypothetical protein